MHTQQQFDSVFLQIMQGITQEVIQTTSASVKSVLSISNEFLSESAQRALTNFHDLYCENQEINTQKQQIADDVDDLFDTIQQQIESGIEVSVDENKERAQARMGLAALQKQLEALITFEAGIRDKFVPAVMSMQFEDSMLQRINRLNTIWDIFMTASKEVSPDWGAAVEKMKSFLSSKIERSSFYEIILEEKAPQFIDANEPWLDDLFDINL